MNKITPERLLALAVWMGKERVKINEYGFVEYVDEVYQDSADYETFNPDKDPAQAFELLEELFINEQHIHIEDHDFEGYYTINKKFISSKYSFAEGITLAAMELAGV